jgi:hypothetical protein
MGLPSVRSDGDRRRTRDTQGHELCLPALNRPGDTLPCDRSRRLRHHRAPRHRRHGGRVPCDGYEPDTARRPEGVPPIVAADPRSARPLPARPTWWRRSDIHTSRRSSPSRRALCPRPPTGGCDGARDGAGQPVYGSPAAFGAGLPPRADRRGSVAAPCSGEAPLLRLLLLIAADRRQPSPRPPRGLLTGDDRHAERADPVNACLEHLTWLEESGAGSRTR